MSVEWTPAALVASVAAMVVFADALSLRRRTGLQPADLHPLTWGVVALVFPPVAVPLYVWQRFRVQRDAAQE